MDSKIVAKIVTIISIFLIIGFLFVVWQNPTTGYEISIYSSLPSFAWLLIFLVVLGGTSIVIHSVYYDNSNWKYGFLLLVLTNLVVISLPLMKGYLFYDFSDNFTHLANAKDILNTGHFPETNFYPILHIILAELSLLAGISLMNIFKALIPILFLFFIISFYVFNKEIFQNKNIVIISTLLASMPFLKYSYYAILIPNSYSFMLLPIILFLYFKSDKEINFSISLIILLLLIPFSHPLTTIMLIVFFLVAEISRKLYLQRMGKKYHIKNTKSLILTVLFFTWISSYAVFNKSLVKVLDWINGELIPVTSEVSSSLQKLNLSLYDQIILFLKMYGLDAFLLLFATITTLYLIKQLYNKKETNEKLNLMSSFFMVSFLMIFVFLLTGNPNFEPLRSLNFVFFLAIPLAAFSINYLLTIKGKLSAIIVPSIIILVTLSSFSGLIVVFDSPYIYKPNLQLTEANYNGMDWFYSNKEENVKGFKLESSIPFRFGEEKYGINAIQYKKDLDRWQMWQSIPDHLTYDQFQYIGLNLTEPKYLPISTLDQRSYLEIWYELNRYSKQDFNKLENDISVSKIYNNGDLKLYFINPI